MFLTPLSTETRHRSSARAIQASRALASLVILGVVLLSGQTITRATTISSNWASLNADAAQSNANPNESGISADTVLKMRVRWTAPLPDLSYPVVADGRVYLPTLVGNAVHARAVDAATGKPLAVYTKGAIGGILAANGSVYLAGRSLEQLDPSTGSKTAEIKGGSTSSHATFTFPLADHNLLVSGYASDSQSVPNGLYGIDSASSRVLWRLPSLNTQGTIGGGRVITVTAAGSVFCSARTGRQLARQKSVFSDWFTAGSLAYTVASVNRKNAALYAYNTSSGRKVWSHEVGPAMNSIGWPHAVNADGLYVVNLKPHAAVEAVDPVTGDVLWKRNIGGVQRLAIAHGLLFVLTADIGQPLHLVVLRAKTGKPVGSISLSGGFYAFSTTNELMVASGMVFIRAVGPGSATQLVALGK